MAIYPTLIMVVGASGVGKTTFVNQATGSMLPVGHGPTLCTTQIAGEKFHNPGKEVTLIDTPGFNNLRTPDIEILDYIAWILGEFARAGRYLTGIIFLQAIDQRKIAPAEFKLVQLIKNICGSHAYENIIIVTTLWSDCPDGKRALIQVRDREELLWSDMIDGGTEVWQHHNSPHSAWAIVEQLARQTVVVLDLQYELDVNDGRLLSTTAGREAHQVAYGMYCVEQKSLYATIRQLKHELRMANHYNDYLQRRCADLEIERSAKKFEEQEVRRKKIHWSDKAPAWIEHVVFAGGQAAATEIGRGMCACQ